MMKTNPSLESEGIGRGERVSHHDPDKKGNTTPPVAQVPSSISSSGESGTGRWTNEEHVLFLKGLEQYGKGWKKIAKLIKTRTVVQIRTHAQKYFQKLSKAKRSGSADLYLDGKPNLNRKGRFGKRRNFFYGSFVNIHKKETDQNSDDTNNSSPEKCCTNEGKSSSFQCEGENDKSKLTSRDESLLSAYLAPHVRKWNEEGIESALFTFLTPATTELDDENSTSTKQDPLLELEKEEYDHNNKQYSYNLRNPKVQQNENQNIRDQEKLLNEEEIRNHLKNMERMGLQNHPIYAIFSENLRKREIENVNQTLAQNANQNQGCTNMNLYDGEEGFGTSMHGYFSGEIPIEVYTLCKVPLWYDKASDINALLSCAQDMNWAVESNTNNLKLN